MSKKNNVKEVVENTEVKVDIKDTKAKVSDWTVKKVEQAKEAGNKVVNFVKRNAVPFGVGAVTGLAIGLKIAFTGAREEDFIDDLDEEDIDLGETVEDLVAVGDVDEDEED